VLLSAALLAACLLLVAVALPPRLARADWPLRAPVLGLVLWQAAGLAGGLLALTLCATVALAPLGTTPLGGLRHLDRTGVLTVVAGAVGLAVLLRLLAVLLTSTWRTTRARHANRLLVDLVGEPNLLLRDISVVDHEVPIAYCLPGLRPRLVLSRGTLSLLSYDELRAVLAHERAHLAQRHDLVVLPFVALGATFPTLPGVRTARSQVSLLVELLADDRAARHHDRQELARALWKIGTGETPVGALALSAAVTASPLLGVVVPLLV
jgi:Zn-dependent protease with chaperone function